MSYAYILHGASKTRVFVCYFCSLGATFHLGTRCLCLCTKTICFTLFLKALVARVEAFGNCFFCLQCMPGNHMFGLTLRAMFSLRARNPCAFWHFWSIWYPEWTCLETCFACMPGNNMCCHFEDHCLLKCMNTNCFMILFKPLVPRVDVFGNRFFPLYAWKYNFEGTFNPYAWTLCVLRYFESPW